MTMTTTMNETRKPILKMAGTIVAVGGERPAVKIEREPKGGGSSTLRVTKEEAQAAGKHYLQLVTIEVLEQQTAEDRAYHRERNARLEALLPLLQQVIPHLRTGAEEVTDDLPPDATSAWDQIVQEVHELTGGRDR